MQKTLDDSEDNAKSDCSEMVGFAKLSVEVIFQTRAAVEKRYRAKGVNSWKCMSRGEGGLVINFTQTGGGQS